MLGAPCPKCGEYKFRTLGSEYDLITLGCLNSILSHLTAQENHEAETVDNGGTAESSTSRSKKKNSPQGGHGVHVVSAEKVQRIRLLKEFQNAYHEARKHYLAEGGHCSFQDFSNHWYSIMDGFARGSLPEDRAEKVLAALQNITPDDWDTLYSKAFEIQHSGDDVSTPESYLALIKAVGVAGAAKQPGLHGSQL